MKVIGITGGVGAGKSEVIKMISSMRECFVVLADDLAKSLEKRGEVCYEPLVELLGEAILGDDGEIDSRKMAGVIFSEGGNDKLEAVNAIVHPAVKKRILELIDAKRQEGCEYFILEAALLIEDHYDSIVDEMWYIYAPEQIRRQRLKCSRGYGDEKIDEIMKNQLSDSNFREHCSIVIDNGVSLENTRRQLGEIFNIDESGCD